MAKKKDIAAVVDTHSAEEKTMDFLQKSAEFIEKHHGKALKRCGLVVLVIVVVIALVASHGRRREASLAEAYQLLGKAQTSAAFLDIADKFKGTQPGALASLKAGRSLFDDNLFERALNQYGRFMQDYPSHALTGNAMLGEASALEALGKLIEAENKFATAAEVFSDQYSRSWAYMSAGRCAEVGARLDKAKIWYELAIGTGADESVKGLAQAGLKRLEIAAAATVVEVKQADDPKVKESSD